MDAEGLRIGQAAALLGVSVDTLRRWEEEGRLALERTGGGQRVVPLAEVARLLSERRAPQPTIAASSARNQLEALVTRVVRGQAAATVEMVDGHGVAARAHRVRCRPYAVATITRPSPR